MNRSLAMMRYYARKAHAGMVVLTTLAAAVMALPWSGTIQIWQVIPAIAAFALGIMASCQLLGAPIIFERLWPIRSRERRILNWLVSMLLAVVGGLPLMIMYWSSLNHVLEAVSLQLICLCLVLGLILRSIILFLGRPPSLYLLIIPLGFLPSALSLTHSMVPWSASSRSSYGMLMLASVVVILVEGAGIVARNEQDPEPSRATEPGMSTRLHPATTADRSHARYQHGSLVPNRPWLAQARVLVLALLNHPEFLLWSCVMFYLTYLIGGETMSATWIFLGAFMLSGTSMEMRVTQTLCLHGLVDRRVALGTVLGSMALCMLISIAVETWVWSPGRFEAIEIMAVLPNAYDDRGSSQESVLRLACEYRSIRLPDGTVMSRDDYALRLQQHHILATPQFVAGQMALATARDEGFMPDPRAFDYSEQGVITTRPILPEIMRTRQFHRILCTGFLVTGLLITLALRRSRPPRPYRGWWREPQLWDAQVPLLLLMGISLWSAHASAGEWARATPVLQDLSYPLVHLTLWQRALLLMDQHRVATVMFLAAICAGCVTIALRRIRTLELDPRQGGSLWQQMQSRQEQR